VRIFAWEFPETTPEVNVALGVGLEHQLQEHSGIDGLGVEGGSAGPQVAGETSGRQFPANQQVPRPLGRSRLERGHVASESAQEQLWSKGARVRLGPAIQ